jgi:hypothetical protein
MKVPAAHGSCHPDCALILLDHLLEKRCSPDGALAIRPSGAHTASYYPEGYEATSIHESIQTLRRFW